MKINAVIGIDPGANGGIALYKPNKPVEVFKMPKDINELRNLLIHEKEIGNPIVFLEKLSVRPDDVSVENGGVNMGKLYRIQKMIGNFEQLKAMITFCSVPFVLVHPMKWQNELHLRQKGVKEEKADRKRRYRDIAGRFYPEVKPTLWNADALLIMHFARYVLQNNPEWVLQNLPESIRGVLSPSNDVEPKNV